MEIARNHALSRRVAAERDKPDEEYHYCPCCGYQIERDEIDFMCDPGKLGFL
jgi:rubrerythrin